MTSRLAAKSYFTVPARSHSDHQRAAQPQSEPTADSVRWWPNSKRLILPDRRSRAIGTSC